MSYIGEMNHIFSTSGMRAAFPVGALLIGTFFGAFFGACGGDATTDGDSSGGSQNSSSGSPVGQGLPCDVIGALQNKCFTCHGNKPTAGSPMSLTSYDSLTAPAKSDPAKTVIQLSIERMKSTTAPMPPGGGASADEIAVLEAWVAAGMPKDSCGMAGMDPFGGASVCTSGKTWTFGEDVSDPMRLQMYPGQACQTCHAQQMPPDVPPVFLVAGTVYPTGHEPNNCYGVDGSATPDLIVRVTDNQMRVYDLPVNASGNFLLLPEVPFEYPYSATVISSKGERPMTEKQSSGDCNACHTGEGGGMYSKAPGRIVIPY